MSVTLKRDLDAYQRAFDQYQRKVERYNSAAGRYNDSFFVDDKGDYGGMVQMQAGRNRNWAWTTNSPADRSGYALMQAPDNPSNYLLRKPSSTEAVQAPIGFMKGGSRIQVDGQWITSDANDLMRRGYLDPGDMSGWRAGQTVTLQRARFDDKPVEPDKFTMTAPDPTTAQKRQVQQGSLGSQNVAAERGLIGEVMRGKGVR